MNQTFTITLAQRAVSEPPPTAGDIVLTPAARLSRALQGVTSTFFTALLTVIVAAGGASLITPAFAETAFVYQQLKAFDVASGVFYPTGDLMQGTDGSLYGTTSRGGAEGGSGAIFKVNPDGSGFTVLKEFDLRTIGALPSRLIQASNGALYGTTSHLSNVFKLNMDGSGFTVIRNLEATEGYALEAGVIQGRDGALYGIAAGGASSGSYGSVFKLNLDGSDFSVLHRFDYWTTGARPYSRLIQGADGTLYGITSEGGSHGAASDGGYLEWGGIFSLGPDGRNFTVLKEFDGSTGGSMFSGLVQDSDGILYGQTDVIAYGMGAPNPVDPTGTIFKLDPARGEFTVLRKIVYTMFGGYPQATLTLGRDGVLYGTASGGGTSYAVDGIGYGTVFKLNRDGTGLDVVLNFDLSTNGAYPRSGLVEGNDGALYGTTQGGGGGGGTVFRLVPVGRPVISALTPPWVNSGSAPFTLTVEGTAFAETAVVQWNGADLDTTFVSSSQLIAAVPNVPTTGDIYTALITVRNPDAIISSPDVFVVLAANVAEIESSVAAAGQSVSVSTAPTETDPNDPDATGNTSGITATLENFWGSQSAITVSTAIYDSDPSSGTSFAIDSATGVAGEVMDLQVTGADYVDRMTALFYYPPGTVESDTSPVLKYFDGSEWVPVLSRYVSPERDTTDNLEGTVSGGRFTVYFDNDSTPKITELGGTFFAITFPRLPLSFTGFLAPIGGADEATGGSFADPVQTFKAGSTIPVKFTASRDGAAIVTGVHTLQATKYSSETTSEEPIDATPPGKATRGNRFELTGEQWHFNLDTKTTGLTKGIWQLVATLSDASQHRVWIQIK